MAKGSKPGGTSRIRFVMVDAEIAEGDIAPITQAIQNALRGSGTGPIQRITSPSKPVDNNGTAPEVEVELDPDDDVIESASESSRSRAPRKPAKTPDVIPLDMNTEVSLRSFAAGKDADSQHKRYLIAAAWLKEHRNIDAVSVGHIYTCYRSMEWPTNIPDFAQPLRELKGRKFFAQPSRGMYAINHLGLDYVRKLGNGGE